MPVPPDRRLDRAALLLTSGALFAGAGLAGRLALQHMAAAGAICGGAVPHCGWCVAAVGLALAGIAAGGLAARPAPARIRVR